MNWQQLSLWLQSHSVLLLCVALFFCAILIISWQLKQISKKHSHTTDELANQIHLFQSSIAKEYQQSLLQIQENLHQNKISLQSYLIDSMMKQMTDFRGQLDSSFKNHSSSLTQHVKSLNEEVRSHLQHLTTQVQGRLSEGFEKTSTTFTDVVKRLTIIDEAQKKITELSSHVMSLQDVLVDKRSRGAFGEVQLEALVVNMLPASNYKMQYTFSNQRRADCVLLLPEPTGTIAIDSKFPLETFQKLKNTDSAFDKKKLQQQFKQDIQKHLKDIAQRYIITGETADSAVMFIPAEAIFAEIHAYYPDLVALSHRLKVWMVSPSTLMAVLTTAKAVLKDDATRKQVHVIQQHLGALSTDFQRFEKRMEKLTRDIDKAHHDVNEVNTSARKITQKFNKIDALELEKEVVTPQVETEA